MTDPGSRHERLAQLAATFLERRRRGETPSLDEYTERCPDLADDIRTLFPILLEAERPRAAAPEAAGPAVPPAAPVRLGDYRLVREVGRGGMGVVYEAVQESLGRRVALKVLPPQTRLEPRQLQRFLREAKAAARLHHTNIVPVFGVGEEGGTHYYVMQYIAGRGLDRVLDELRRARGVPPAPAGASPTEALSPAASSPPAGDAPGPGLLPDPSGGATTDSGRPYWRGAARIALQAAEALAYAHAQGVVHRDVKPSNLLLDANGTVWVADFGLAKLSDGEDLTQTGDVLGTVRYMAPERFEGKADASDDIYALGLTLYELLTLRPAFEGEDRRRLVRQVLHADPPPRRLRPDVPRDLETVVLRAMAREPARRYPTPAALADDLKRFLDDRPVPARRASAAERLARWARRNRGVAASLAALFVVLLAAAVGSTVAAVSFWNLAGEKDRARLDAVRATHDAEDATKGERWERYRADIAAAAGALELHDIDAARRALGDAPEEHRNWEWKHFASLLDGARLVLRGPEAGLKSLALRPDGRLVAAGGKDGDVYLWDADTGVAAGVLRGHEAAVGALAFRPDGRRLASASDDHTVRLWDPAAGKAVHVLHGHGGPVEFVAFSPDGGRLASGSKDGTVRLWDASTGDEVAGEEGGPGPVRELVFSPDGGRLAFARGDPVIHLWDGKTGREAGVPRGHTGKIDALAFSPDGGRVASAADWPDHDPRLWDAATGRQLAVLKGHTNNCRALAFSPDSTRVASGSQDQSVRLWDAATGQGVAVLRGHKHQVWRVLFSPDGARLISAADDRTLRLWDVKTGELLAVMQGHGGAVVDAALGAGGVGLASLSADDGTVRLWDVEALARNTALRGHDSFVYDVAFSPDGEHLASGAWDHTARLWEATAGRQTARLENDGYRVDFVAFSSDGWRLAAVDLPPAEVRVWDLAGGPPLRLAAGPSPPSTRAVFSPDGTTLAVGCEDGVIRLHDAATGEAVGELRGQARPVVGVAFRPDGGEIASAGQDGAIRLWDAATRAPVAVVPHHADRPFTMAYSHDGGLIALGSGDNTVRLWDDRTHEPGGVLRHGSAVYGVAFSPDGTRLAAACADNTIRLWDVAHAAEAASLRGHDAYVHAVAFSPDGTRLASASGDGTVRVWDTLSAQERAAKKRE